MKKWAIEIVGHKIDLEYLFQIQPNQPNSAWSIVKYDDNFYLESTNFNNKKDSQEIKVIGSDILETINGIAFVKNSKYQPVELQNVCEIDQNGKIQKRYIEALTASIRVQFGGTGVLSGGEDVITPPDPVISAVSNKFYSDAIKIIQKGKEILEFRDLYNILDILEDSGCSRKVLETFGKDVNDKYDDLKLISQSYKAVGKEARHRHSKFDEGYESAKRKPSTNKNEYIELIRKILVKWAEILS